MLAFVCLFANKYFSTHTRVTMLQLGHFECEMGLGRKKKVRVQKKIRAAGNFEFIFANIFSDPLPCFTMQPQNPVASPIFIDSQDDDIEMVASQTSLPSAVTVVYQRSNVISISDSSDSDSDTASTSDQTQRPPKRPRLEFESS